MSEIEKVNCSQTKQDKVRVFVAQPKWEREDWEDIKQELFIPKNTQTQIDYLNAYLEKALESNTDIIIFPELSILEEHLILIDEWVKENKIIVVAGSQYYETVGGKKNISPIYINEEIVKKEKTVSAGDEKSVLSEKNLIVGKTLYKLENTICGTLCIAICAEYLNPKVRYKLTEKDDIDVLIVIALQKDSNEYYQPMELNTKESTDGMYIVYANNYIEGISDGGSSIFGMVNKSFKRTQSYNYDHQAYILENNYNYFVAELDLKYKKSPVKKNTDTNTNINIIDKGNIDISKRIDTSNFEEICDKYDKNHTHSSKMTWQEKLETMMFILHQKIEHKILSIEHQHHNPPHSDILRDENIDSTIKEILCDIKNIFDLFVGDISVHIKLEEKIKNTSTNQYDDYLRTLYREPSNQRDEGNNEIFKIIDHNNIKVLKSTTFNNKFIKINSAYNTVLLDSSKSWLCNNLVEAKKENLYYSTSAKWEEHYKSLAIFPIADRYENYTNNRKNFKGLLILDSKNTECFDPEFTKQLGGFIAHRLNNFFSLKEVYEKYFNN